tara:strand:- start:1143 stop:1577 length:435 start_codon:yes stop_codon:yes gene_type:complete
MNISIILFISLLSLSFIQSSQKVEIEIENIDCKRGGTILMAIFSESNKNDFPSNDKGIYQYKKLQIQNKPLLKIKLNLPPGKYAIALLHDENGNNEMDYNWVHYPQEGFGFSKNPKIILSEPDFDECAFSIPTQSLIKIKMVYK